MSGPKKIGDMIDLLPEHEGTHIITAQSDVGIILDLGKAWCEMSPDAARRVAKSLLHMADDLDGGKIH